MTPAKAGGRQPLEEEAPTPRPEPQEKPETGAKEAGQKASEPSKKPAEAPADEATGTSQAKKLSKAQEPKPAKRPEARVEGTLSLSGEQYDPKLLEKKSKDELIEIILKLNADLARITSRVDVDIESTMPTFKSEVKVEEFIRLPAAPSRKQLAHTDTLWRVILISSSPTQKPLGLEISGDVVVGRRAGQAEPDLDLTRFDAARLGMSRRHAMLRPTKADLVLVDLRSTNGTFHNGARIDPGVIQKVKDGDTLSFGQLHLKVRIVGQPTTS